MKLARHRGKTSHSWKVGFKPEPTRFRGNGGSLLLAALIAWEVRKDGGRQLSQWDVVKLRRAKNRNGL
jgi:hypothetical protein